MGVHPEGPSEADAGLAGETGGGKLSLAELISRNSGYYLGAEVNREFGVLPFLFKLLAAGKPLSIQVHPTRDQAGAGWERENKAGISPKAPNRNYKDPNHKPEILCALLPFTAMCGFREVPEIRRLLDLFFRIPSACRTPLFRSLRNSLEPADPGEGLKNFLRTLFSLTPEERRTLSGYTLEQETAHPEMEEWKTAAAFARLYPEDSGVIAPLYLNLLHLSPGEAIYLPAGILHAYIEGFGVELMANSDNVLRGGLTSKHVDPEELAAVLRFAPYKPAILKPEDPRSPCFTYPTGCREFSLSVLRGEGGSIPFPLRGPHIVVVTRGQVRLSRGGSAEELILEQGESAYIVPEAETAAPPAPGGSSNPPLSLGGDFTLYAAGAGV
jgi:mannose-6-phosphate isomerase